MQYEIAFLSLYKQKYNAAKIKSIFLSQEAGDFGNNIEKEPQKQRPKLKKYI